MPKLNKNKVVIYGKNKDVAKMQELKAKHAAKQKAVFFQNPDFIHDDSHELETHIVDAGEVIIIGKAEDHESFARVAELHKDQAPGKPDISHIESPAIQQANKRQEARKNGGGGESSGMGTPTDSWNKDKIQAWLTLNDIEFKANANKDELLELVP